ncbi:hypothetical protein A2159_00965 [Candidatus Woesebacteria bacterium RBG_13_34_9]|uniref:Uncharacterized protein n=1 Tax=Candidatus Woesebacteria bacterium RBG_13_34_9 TaxID=1802477 RepID=A0A1F7X310_9BACT|nr:MAG: hypothetical protein A2159_00965 [Candidatus Woesebacteria bacterium RBG_13_34_9]
MKLPQTNNSKGQILLSIVISMAIFAILSSTLFTLISSSYSLITYNKARITGRYLAQEKMEIIRNMPYEDIGTSGGIPNGNLLQEEKITKNGLVYTIKTSIIYIDDPYDDIAPLDTSPEDYKRVRVEASWEGLAASKKNPVVLLTDVSAYATGVIEGGTLIVSVTDSNNNPVSQAEVQITATSTTPPVDTKPKTDSSGKVILPGSPPCVSCYQITVTKLGYSSDRTYSTGEVANPIKSHTSVFEDDVTQISFQVDKLGSISISSFDSRENNFNPLGNVAFRLHGNKIIGTDAYAQPVYKYDENLSTNESGNLTLNNMEWDVYHILMLSSSSYDISGTTPLTPFYLSPEGNSQEDFCVTSHTTNSFFITIKDSSSSLIASATARLYDDSGFENIKTSGIEDNPDFGQLLFSNLNEKTFHLEATASGFINYLNDFDVSGSSKADVILQTE